MTPTVVKSSSQGTLWLLILTLSVFMSVGINVVIFAGFAATADGSRS